jgi:hypothetical protein
MGKTSRQPHFLRARLILNNLPVRALDEAAHQTQLVLQATLMTCWIKSSDRLVSLHRQ